VSVIADCEPDGPTKTSLSPPPGVSLVQVTCVSKFDPVGEPVYQAVGPVARVPSEVIVPALFRFNVMLDVNLYQYPAAPLLYARFASGPALELAIIPVDAVSMPDIIPVLIH